MPADWDSILERQAARHADAIERLPLEPDGRQKQLVRAANAALGAGLAGLMSGAPDASSWLRRAADLYRESFDAAPPGSWGRLIGALKMRLLAADADGAHADAHWALAAGPAASPSPIGRYAACLAHLVLGDDRAALPLARSLAAEAPDVFPQPVALALLALAQRDVAGYEPALVDVVHSFETRDAHLEDVPIADTALVLEVLAERRSMAVRPSSQLLPER